MLVDLEVFYLGHLKNFYTIQYNTIVHATKQSEICIGLSTVIRMVVGDNECVNSPLYIPSSEHFNLLMHDHQQQLGIERVQACTR